MTPPFAPLYFAGQTGSGKTAVALELANHLGPIEIVNADAFQVYSGMEILSAAPTAAEREAVPHHLFGVLDPTEECDAASFARLAREAITEVAHRSVPLVVGGSGLYLKAITHGLAPTPKGDPQLRAELESRPLEELIEQYTHLDPAGAASTNLKNRRYVTRNLEICLLTGRPASTIKNEWQEKQPDIRAICLQRERADIYDRINRRTLTMFKSGVIEEVASLGELSATASKAIGIREIRALLNQEIDRDSCIEEIQKITRRYAKRQETWFRREKAFLPIPVSSESRPEEIARKILSAYPSR